MDDSESVSAAVADERESRETDFTEFYRHEVTSLVAFLIWQGAALAEAADVAQEAMIQAHRYWGTINHPRAWVRRVASRTFARRIATVEEPVEDVGGLHTALLPATSNIEAWTQRHDVLKALRKLPMRQRQVMAWTLDSYTPAEIAEELKITPEAVRSNLKKARRALAEHLAEGEDKQ